MVDSTRIGPGAPAGTPPTPEVPPGPATPTLGAPRPWDTAITVVIGILLPVKVAEQRMLSPAATQLRVPGQQ